MPLSDVQINEFMVLWKESTAEDISSGEARLIVGRLLHLYRVLVHRIPSNRSPTAGACRPAEHSAGPVPESS